MNTLALLTISCIGLSLFSEVSCLPSSSESSQSWLSRRTLDSTRSLPSKRSPTSHKSICLLGGRSALEKRSSLTTESGDDDDACDKSTDSSEENDLGESPSIRKFTPESASNSASARSPSQKVSKSNSNHSFSQLFSKSTIHDKSHIKSGHHSFIKKPHSAANHVSVKSTKSTEDSAGSSLKGTGSSMKYRGSLLKHKVHKDADNSAESSGKETGISEKYKGSTLKHKSSQKPVDSVESPVKTDNYAQNKDNGTEGPVNETASAMNDAANVVDNSEGATSDPASAVQGPAEDHHGKATFFYQGGNPGACGKVHHDSAFIVAIQSKMFESGKHCGKTVVITRKSTGKTIKAKAADECPGCPTEQSLDLSLGAFNALASPEEGVCEYPL